MELGGFILCTHLKEDLFTDVGTEMYPIRTPGFERTWFFYLSVTDCDRVYVAQGRYVTLGRKAKRADDRDSCADELCRFNRDVFTLPRRVLTSVMEEYCS